jgi:hypothetical protein
VSFIAPAEVTLSVVGKTTSLAAMALTFGFYVHAPLARPLGILAVAALTAVNCRGVSPFWTFCTARQAPVRARSRSMAR